MEEMRGISASRVMLCRFRAEQSRTVCVLARGSPFGWCSNSYSDALRNSRGFLVRMMKQTLAVTGGLLTSNMW